MLGEAEEVDELPRLGSLHQLWSDLRAVGEWISAQRYGVTRRMLVEEFPDLFAGAEQVHTAAERRFYRRMRRIEKLTPGLVRVGAPIGLTGVWVQERFRHLVPDPECRLSDHSH